MHPKCIKENKNICKPWELVVTQVQWNQEDLLIPDGVDIFPWHLLLAKCFVKQTHDLKDFASVGSSEKKKKVHTCKKKILFLFKSHFLIPNHKLFLKTHTFNIFQLSCLLEWVYMCGYSIKSQWWWQMSPLKYFICCRGLGIVTLVPWTPFLLKALIWDIPFRTNVAWLKVTQMGGIKMWRNIWLCQDEKRNFN